MYIRIMKGGGDGAAGNGSPTQTGHPDPTQNTNGERNMSKNTTETKPVTPAAILTDAAAQSKAGNAPSMPDLSAALAEAEQGARASGKAPKMLPGIGANTWALLAKGGPIAQGKGTEGHRRFFKGLLPRLPAADRAKVAGILAHYSFKL
jgi:hypothetical protein